MKTIRNLLVIIVGNIILMFGVAAFLEPTGIISGGTAGIGLIVQSNFHIPISITLAVVNGVSFFLGLFVLGRKFAVTTLVSSLISPFILHYFESIPALATLTNDLFLSAVMAGILSGVGVGLVMRVGASTGGMDIPPLILNKITGIQVGTLLMVMDGIILLLQIPFSNTEQILYGIVRTILTSFSLNWILMLGTQQAQLLIISPQYEVIRQALIKSDVGLTMMPIITGFAGKSMNAILCAIPTRKLPQIRSTILEIDKTTFLLVTTAAEIAGRGFTLPR